MLQKSASYPPEGYGTKPATSGGRKRESRPVPSSRLQMVAKRELRRQAVGEKCGFTASNSERQVADYEDPSNAMERAWNDGRTMHEEE